MTPRRKLLAAALLLAGGLAASPTDAVYTNDFEKAEVGTVPDDLMVLNGTFAVKKDAGNAFLELPGDPLETFGFMAGPEDPAPSAVAARIWADVSGKRFPEFGVGLRGSGGYKLWLMPIVGELQILKGDQVVAKTRYAWKPATWTTLRFRLREAGGKWVAEGKAWEHGQPEPAQWTIAAGLPAAPPGGRASAWGIPFSSKPIRFDDVAVGK